MFTYYLSSLHEYREKNLELGQATSRAWMEMVAHLIDGQYLIGRAVLHPAIPILEHHAGAHWQRETVNDHQELVMKWLDEGVAKATKAQEIVFAAFTHHAAGWETFGHEFLRKLQRDVGPEYTEALQMMDQTLQGIASAESTALESAHNAVTVPKTISKPAAKKAAVKKPAARKLVARKPTRGVQS